MRKMIIRLLATGALCVALAHADAQPVAGTLLPEVPNARKVKSLEEDVANKTRALEAAKMQLEQAQLSLMQNRLLHYGLPKLFPDSTDAELQKRCYPGYIVGFSGKHGQPQWSTHIIPRAIFTTCHDREEAFFEDRSLSGAPLLEQYAGSGYQRGHMAPAADFRWSTTASKASNLLSNCAPQPKALNEGLWAKLEIGIRNYMDIRPHVDALVVVTGPVLNPALRKLKGRKQGSISIPERFFKVVLNLEDQQGFAFLMETGAPDKTAPRDIEAELSVRMMSIDSLEKLLQMDFFTNLTPEQEKAIEARLMPADFFAVPGIPPFADSSLLVNGVMNTAMLTAENAKACKAVIGRVVRVSVGSGGGVVLYLDDPLPGNRVQVHITATDAKKFNNPTLASLEGKLVQVQGNPFEKGGRFILNVKVPGKLTLLP